MANNCTSQKWVTTDSLRLVSYTHPALSLSLSLFGSSTKTRTHHHTRKRWAYISPLTTYNGSNEIKFVELSLKPSEAFSLQKVNDVWGNNKELLIQAFRNKILGRSINWKKWNKIKWENRNKHLNIFGNFFNVSFDEGSYFFLFYAWRESCFRQWHSVTALPPFLFSGSNHQRTHRARKCLFLL